MSENIIYCYSGSGNCLSMARKIAEELGSTDIVLMRKKPAVMDATAYKRVGFVFPCHGGGLPGDTEYFIRNIRYSLGSYKFAVVQYAGYMGCGLSKIDELVAGGLDYWDGIPQHCSAIWLMPHWLTLSPKSLKLSQKASDSKAKRVAKDVKEMKKSAKNPPKGYLFRMESKGFGNINKLVNSKLNVNDKCVGCGKCAAVCAKDNISIVNGKAVIGKNCVGCMSCVEYCPSEAINVGTITVKRARYHNARISVDDLNEKIITVK